MEELEDKRAKEWGERKNKAEDRRTVSKILSSPVGRGDPGDEHLGKLRCHVLSQR